MALKLHYHPLASFCWKVLIALYEADTPFETELVDLGDESSRGRFLALWPIGKMPVLEDPAHGRVVPETSIIIEYLDLHHGGAMLPINPEARLEARLWDRLYDAYVHQPMQRAVAARLGGDAAAWEAVSAQSRAELATAYDLIERALDGRTWAAGEAFTIADCAAAPALFYAATVAPFPEANVRLAAYFERLAVRPSVARVFAEARPYFHMFPLRDALEPRFRDDA